MRQHRPIGLVRLLAPILGRARRRGRRGLVPMIWRIHRPHPHKSFALPAARLHSSPFHCALNLSLTWAPPDNPVVARERRVERLVREVFRAGILTAGVPGVGKRGLPGLVERCRQWQQREVPARAADAAVAPRPSPSPVGARAAPRPRHRAALAASGDPVFRGLPKRAPSSFSAATRSHAAPIAFPRAARAGAAVRAMGGVMARAKVFRVAGEAGSDAPAGPTRRRARVGQLWRGHEAAIRLAQPARVSRRSASARIDPAGARSSAVPVWRDASVPGGPDRRIAAGPGAPASGVGRPGLVWREPAPRKTRAAAQPEAGRSSAPGLRSEPVVHARHPERPTTVPASLPEVGRLVDEVVRRLERIGRDERLRRGL